MEELVLLAAKVGRLGCDLLFELERGIEPPPPPYHGTQGEPRVLDDLTTCLTTC